MQRLLTDAVNQFGASYVDAIWILHRLGAFSGRLCGRCRRNHRACITGWGGMDAFCRRALAIHMAGRIFDFIDPDQRAGTPTVGSGDPDIFVSPGVVVIGIAGRDLIVDVPS